jgi:hypothetical protein
MSPLGCSSPVQSPRSQNAGFIRYSFLHPCPRTRLLGHSSPGVRLPFTVCPEASAFNLGHQGLNQKPLSWGSLPLQRMQETRVHVPTDNAGHPASSEGLPGLFLTGASTGLFSDQESTDGSQLVSYGPALRLSQPLSGVLPLTSVPPFSGGWRSWGSTLQGFTPHTKLRQLIAAALPS